MRREIRKHEVQAPNYDPNEEPLMDVNRIRELLHTTGPEHFHAFFAE